MAQTNKSNNKSISKSANKSISKGNNVNRNKDFGQNPGNSNYPLKKGCCCNYFCNKRGLFTEIDMAFSNFMQLVPNSNVACRCCNKLYTAPIFQGRSCACLIRPRQRPYRYGYGINNGRGCSPERCGCNNHIYEDIYL